MGNLAAVCLTALLIVCVISVIGGSAIAQILSSEVARKLLHTFAGILYMSVWPQYDDSPYSKWLAAGLIAVTTSYFVLVGFGIMRDKFLTASATRTGQAKDLLKGPFCYGCVHIVLTLLYWRDSPVGVMALAALCGGDGLAVFGGMLGRRIGGAASTSLPWNRRKTWAGSIACFLGSLAASVPLLFLLASSGHIDLEAHEILRGCVICSACCAVVESLPIIEWDNLSVPAAVALLASSSSVFRQSQ